MKAWSLFHPDVMPELPGALAIMVNHWLRNISIEFCERTRAHVVMLDAESSEAGIGDYYISVPTGTIVHEVVSVSYKDSPMEPKSHEYLDSVYGTDWINQTGTPTLYTQYEPGTLVLVPAPAAVEVGAIKIRACLKPSESSTGITDWLYAQFRGVIAEGAKAKMMSMVNVPWRNIEQAGICAGRFEQGVADASDRVQKALVRAKPRFSGRFC
jgi:hypothetical protein